jgi:replication initiation and membrane attachment protein DnaB
MNKRKNRKFDLERALYDAMDGIAKENTNQSADVFTEILQKTGITPDEMKKIIAGRIKAEGGIMTINQLYYSIIGYMRSHKMETGHIL